VFRLTYLQDSHESAESDQDFKQFQKDVWNSAVERLAFNVAMRAPRSADFLSTPMAATRYTWRENQGRLQFCAQHQAGYEKLDFFSRKVNSL
jgi:hypothetical protein